MRCEPNMTPMPIQIPNSARNVPYNPPPFPYYGRLLSIGMRPSDSVTRQDLGLGRRIPQTLIDVPPGEKPHKEK